MIPRKIQRLSALKRLLILLALGVLGLFLYQHFVYAATCNWQSSGSTSWNTTGNWSCGHVPTSADDVVFTNASSATSVTLDATVNVKSINIGSSYPGTFDQSTYAMTIGTSGFTQSSGTFTGSTDNTKNIDISTGSFSVTGGAFTATAGTLGVGGNFTVTTPGTFTAGTGTISFNGAVCASSSINAPSVTFNTPVSINRTINCNNNYTLTIAANTTIPLGTTPTVTLKNNSSYAVSCAYYLTNNGTITVDSGDLTVSLNGTYYAGALTNNTSVDAHNTSTFTVNGTLTNSSGATFSTAAGTNTFNIGGGFVISATSASFPTTDVTLNLVGGSGIGTNNIDASTVTFNTPVTINRSSYYFGTATLTIVSGTTIPLGNSPSITLDDTFSSFIYNFTNNGTITAGTGTLTMNLDGSGTFTNNSDLDISSLSSLSISGALTNNSGKTITATGLTSWSTGSVTNSGTITASNTDTFTINGSLTNNSGATFTTKASPTFNIGGSFTVNAASASFPTSNVSLNLNGSLCGNSSVDASTVTFNATVTINRTISCFTTDTTLSITSGTTIPLGNNSTITLKNTLSSAFMYHLTNNGTITAGTGTLTVSLIGTGTTAGTFTNNGTLNLSSATGLTVSGHFTNNAAKAVNAGSSLNFTTSGNASINVGSTFPTTLGTLTFSGSSGTQTVSIPMLTSTTSFVKNAGSSLAFSQTHSTGNFTFSGGTINNPGSSYSINIGGTFNMSSAGTLGGANLPIVFNNSSDQTLTKSAGTFASPFTVSSTGGATVKLLSALTTSSTCTVSSGTFDINGYAFTCGSTFTVQNGGTLKLIGTESPTTPTLNSGSTVEYKGNGDGTEDTYVFKDWSYANLTVNMPNDSLAPSYPAPPSGNLVANWPMNESSGTTAVSDTTGNNNGTSSSSTNVTTGKSGNARTFTTNYIEAPDTASLRIGDPYFSYSGWINPGTITGCGADGSGGCIIVNKENSYEWGISNTGKIHFAIRNTSPGWAWVNTTVVIPTGTWTHVVLTYDGSNVRTYTNGSLGKTSPATGNVDNTNYRNALRIGARGAPGAATALFPGSIDEERLYNDVLTPTEVTNLYYEFDSPLASISIAGNLTISSGTFVSPATLTIGGSFTNNATFTHNNGTVVFNDASQTSILSGSGTPAITFYNLTSTTAGKTLQFTQGQTFKIDTGGTLTLTGTSGSKVNINSTTSTQWLIDHHGSESVTNTTVTNSGCAGTTTDISVDATDTNGGNNGACWLFGSDISVKIKTNVHIKQGVRIGNN